jgi:hypothetical protein
MKLMSDTYAIIGSSGELERYEDNYNVDSETALKAQHLEEYIIEQQSNIETSFLKIGAALVQFDSDQLWRARGMPSFRAWASGPELHFSYAHATRLMRIVRDLIPRLGEIPTTSVSTLTEMLPMLSNGSTDEDIQQAYEDIQGLTTRDAKIHLQELRGITQAPRPVIFSARVRQTERWNYVDVTRQGDDDTYLVTKKGPLEIKPSDWDAWAERFGAFITYD